MNQNQARETAHRPLDGIRVVEMAGLAPSPYCGMILADFGADVVVVDRPAEGRPEIPNLMEKNPFYRGKRFIRVNLKSPEGVGIVKKMMERYDVLIEPYRPGVMESLSLGPGEALKINPSLIYARLTGWGQEGPYASMAGHDINYIGVSGALSLFRRKGERPLPPCNLLGDFAGGGMLCAMGILLALIERNRSGKGQVIDAAMVDGSANLTTFFFGLRGHGLMTLDIGTNVLDSGAPYYQTYETADGKFIAVGAIEARFYEKLIEGLGLDPSALPDQNDMKRWPEMIDLFARTFKTKTRDEWMEIFEGTDACVAPILELNEVASHPHNRHRGVFLEREGIVQPAPAPRLSRTPGAAGSIPEKERLDTHQVLHELGYTEKTIDLLLRQSIIE
ncbi:MAG TPA: CoA transferase [Desulfobacteraceae bacterium]|nr:CoA transferase [Desulfobacteraceae bacterium]